MPRRYRKGPYFQFTTRLIASFVIIFALASLFFIFLIPRSNSSGDKVLDPISRLIIRLSPIGKIADDDLLSKGGNYAVVIRNLKTGENYSLNKDQVFHSASLYKLWVLAVAEIQIKEGKLKPDQTLSAKKKSLDKELGTLPNEEQVSPTPTDSTSPAPSPVPETAIFMKVNEAMSKMITVSDNYAALLLVHKLGAKNISSFIKQNGFSASAFGSPPTTSSEDIADYFQKLYQKEFVNSDNMIDLLKKQKINDRLPKYLPNQTIVAHKTGELSGAKHDGGIVFTKKGDYIIVVLSQTNNESSAAENEALFSRDIFNYFGAKE